MINLIMLTELYLHFQQEESIKQIYNLSVLFINCTIITVCRLGFDSSDLLVQEQYIVESNLLE